MSNAWVCTPCGALRAGCEPFEEKSIGGAGPRTCVRCGVTKERMDGMHMVTVRDDEVFTPLQIINALWKQLEDWDYDERSDGWSCDSCSRSFDHSTKRKQHAPGCERDVALKAAERLLNEKMAKTTAGPTARGPRESAEA